MHQTATRVSGQEAEHVRPGDHARGLAVDEHQRGVGLGERAHRRVDSASPAPIDRQRRRHVLGRPGRPAARGRRTGRRAGRARRPSPPPRPPSPAARPARPASGRRRTRAGCRWRRRRSRSGGRARARGSRRPCARSTSPTVAPVARRQEAVVGHPRVVEDLGEVAAAAVGQQHDDHGVGGRASAATRSGRDRRHPARAADQQPLLAGQPPGHRERVGVGDRDDLVGRCPCRRWRARSPRRRPRPGTAARCRRSTPSPPGRRRSPATRPSDTSLR